MPKTRPIHLALALAGALAATSALAEAPKAAAPSAGRVEGIHRETKLPRERLSPMSVTPLHAPLSGTVTLEEIGAAPSAPGEKAPTWHARQGDQLRTTLTRWAEAAGWTVVWNTEHDFILRANADFEGEFVDSASTLIEAFAQATPPIFAQFYAGNRVVVVTTPNDLDVN